jgi:hypothetical protein
MNLQRCVNEFHLAAQFLIFKMKNDGWCWSSNFLREYVRCAYCEEFSNSDSPTILRELRRQHPELASYIDIGTLKVKK